MQLPQRNSSIFLASSENYAACDKHAGQLFCLLLKQSNVMKWVGAGGMRATVLPIPVGLPVTF